MDPEYGQGNVGGEVQRYECPECGAVRLLSDRRPDVECKECSASMQYAQGKIVENPASIVHQIEDDVREVKDEEDLRYR